MEFAANVSGADVEALTAAALADFRAANRTVGREIAKVGRSAILTDVRGSRRGGLSFSGMNANLGVRATIEPHGNRVDVTLAAGPAGAWAIVDSGSVPHVIRARGSTGALVVEGKFYAAVRHPGTTGRRFWDAAEPALDAAVFPTIADTFDDALGV